MRNLVHALVLCALSFGAVAAPKTFTIVAPTTDTNGLALPGTGPGSLVSMAIDCANTLATLQAKQYVVSIYPIAPSQSTVMYDFGVGDWFCNSAAMNSVGWGATSNVVSFTVAAPTPVYVRPSAPVLSVN